MSAFTHYWAGSTCDGYYEEDLDGQTLDHVAGSQFTGRGVRKGDTVFVVNITNGELYLIGRLRVGRIVHSDAEARRLIGYEPWSAPDHCIAEPGTGTPMRLRRTVPPETARALRFKTRDGKLLPLKFVSATELYGQTLRGVRELSPQSAKLLDEVIKRSP